MLEAMRFAFALLVGQLLAGCELVFPLEGAGGDGIGIIQMVPLTTTGPMVSPPGS